MWHQFLTSQNLPDKNCRDDDSTKLISTSQLPKHFNCINLSTFTRQYLRLIQTLRGLVYRVLQEVSKVSRMQGSIETQQLGDISGGDNDLTDLPHCFFSQAHSVGTDGINIFTPPLMITMYQSVSPA